MYIYYLKTDLLMDDNHVFKKGKVMATSKENVLNNDFYDVIQAELTKEQLEKQGFLYIVNGKPIINDKEFNTFNM